MWKKMLYGVCMKYTNDINQAQDYCQNGFMKVYKNLDLFTGEGSLEGWIRKVINNNGTGTLESSFGRRVRKNSAPPIR